MRRVACDSDLVVPLAIYLDEEHITNNGIHLVLPVFVSIIHRMRLNGEIELLELVSLLPKLTSQRSTSLKKSELIHFFRKAMFEEVVQSAI